MRNPSWGWAVALASMLAFALLLPACGGSSKSANSPSSDKTWLASLVDDSVDTQLRVRPQDLAKDPLFGPILQRSMQQAAGLVAALPTIRNAFETFQKAQLVIVAMRAVEPRDAVIIFVGLPDSVSPDAMNDELGQPMWKKSESSVAGTTEYQRASGSPDDPASATRLVIIGHTWVAALGPAVERLHAALAAGKPEELHADSGPLLEASGVGDVIENAKKDHGGQISPFTDGLSRVDLQVEGGDSAHVKMAMTYKDEDSATHAQSFVQLLLTAASAREPDLKSKIDSVTVEREKEKLTVQTPLSAEFLQAVMQQPASMENPSAPPSSRPTRLPTKKHGKSSH